jgi:hypothetical protein
MESQVDLDDSRLKLLSDLTRLFESNRVWGGDRWVYQPIHPALYLPIAERVQRELSRLTVSEPEKSRSNDLHNH